MEQWLNLFVKVAVPLFKTLVYSGTNTVLSSLQTELKNQQKEQQKQLLTNLGIETDNHSQEESKNLESFGQAQDLITSVSATYLEFKSQLFYQEKNQQKEQFNQRRETLLKLAIYQRETTLRLPEVQQSFEHWPLRLFPCQLLESSPTSQPIPLRIFLAPPQINWQYSQEQKTFETSEVERILAQGIRNFVQNSYGSHNSLRPIEFLGGAWKSSNFYGESSIKAMFWMLKSQPTLVLESEIVGEQLIFRCAYWNLGQEHYFYKTIWQLSYQDFLQKLAQKRALEWQKNRDKLLKLGKDQETISRLGGTNEINLAIFEEVEKLRAAEIDIKNLSVAYQISYQDLKSLLKFLTFCHCLVTGWLADLHYLINNDVAPIFPQSLPQLIEQYSEHQLDLDLVETTVSLYQEVLQTLGQERAYWLPELTLKLAKSLIHLPDKSLAEKQLQYSLKLWLEQRHLSSLEKIQDLETIQAEFIAQERAYLEMLQECFIKLGNQQKVNQLHKILTRFDLEKKPRLLPVPLHFSRANSFSIPSSRITCLLTNTEQQTLISLKEDNIIELWRMTEENLLLSQQLNHQSGQVLALAVTPDGQNLVSSVLTKQRSYLKVWDLATGKLKETLFGHKQPIYSLLISQDGETIFSASHKIKLWNLKTGKSFQTLFGHKKWVTSLGISQKGQFLITGSQDTTVRIWNLQNGELIRTLKGHQGSVTQVLVTANEEIVISGSEDKTIKLWDIKTGKLWQTFSAHSGAINAMILSKSSQYLISGSKDTTIKIWDLQTRRCLQTLTGHSSAITTLNLSSDEQILLSSSQDHTLTTWFRINSRCY
jgi:WD40 repeat protein